MKKRFNITGVCIPEKHYMADISDKLSKIRKMIDQGDYFVINRPRQYGKTTTLYLLNKQLKNSSAYFPIKISFESLSEDRFKNETLFINAFLLQLKKVFNLSKSNDLVKFIESSSHIEHIDQLDLWISDLVTKLEKKTVLMIDEVDKSCNNQLFLDFLGMLRNKYLEHNENDSPTFHSVILAGVHDVKSLKIKIRPDSEAKFNSPWNIAVDFDIDLSLSTKEIESMLEDYSKEQNIKIDIPFFTEKLFYYTSGYPFLVSYLCKTIAETIIPGKSAKEWKEEDLEKAFQTTLKKDNTNFESLIKNLENNSELYDFVFKLIMNGTEFLFNRHIPVIHLGKLYGILEEENGKVRVHNRLYEQIIYNYMASKLETSGDVAIDHITSNYLDESGYLDIKSVFLKYGKFINEHYGEKDRDFIERNGRLLFLAFIRPIINGRGFDFKEVQISEEKRLDVVITFDNKKYIIELKLWRGEAYHQAGISQLCNYLDKQNKTEGYLLIYDLRKESGQTGKSEIIEQEGKKIFAAWV